MSHKAKTIRAKWILNPGQEPVRDSFLTVHNGTIASISKRHDGAYEDLGHVALIPGLVNSHTHLEFSHLERPLGHRGIHFPDWLKCVVAHRFDEDVPPKSERVQIGFNECSRSGTVAIGEIATKEAATTLPRIELTESLNQTRHPTTVVAFQEWLSLAPDQLDHLLRQQEQLESAIANYPFCTVGVSPHAPYTIHPDSFEMACTHARKKHLPVAMHIAETESELELLATGSGPFRDFLESLGVFQPSAFSVSRNIDWYLERLAKTPKVLVIHGNYLDSRQLNFLADNRDRMSLVYCPRTHDYFEHAPYPLLEARRAGVRVALGTDSRASNPDLDIWSEFRFLLARFPSLEAKEALKMITTDGAIALGLGSTTGMLATGAPAQVWSFPVDSSEADPWESVRSETAASLTFVPFE